MGEFEEWEIALHGRRVIYRIAGSGPPVVLIHGMLNSSRHWQRWPTASPQSTRSWPQT